MSDQATNAAGKSIHFFCTSRNPATKSSQISRIPETNVLYLLWIILSANRRYVRKTIASLVSSNIHWCATGWGQDMHTSSLLLNVFMEDLRSRENNGVRHWYLSYETRLVNRLWKLNSFSRDMLLNMYISKRCCWYIYECIHLYCTNT